MKKHIKLLAVLTFICILIFAFAACGITGDGEYNGAQPNGGNTSSYYCPYGDGNTAGNCPYHDSCQNQHNPNCTGTANRHHSGHGAHHSYHC